MTSKFKGSEINIGGRQDLSTELGVLFSANRYGKLLNMVERIAIPRAGAKIRNSITATLQQIAGAPVPADFYIYDVDTVKKLLKRRDLLTPINKKFYDKLYKSDFSKNHIDLSLRLLKSFGYIEILEDYKGRYALLTILGDLVKSHIENISKKRRKGATLNVLLTLVLPGLIFSTKARVIFGLYYSLDHDLKSYYTSLATRIFGVERRYEGLERSALEVLNEIILTRGGMSRSYISETAVLIRLFSGLRKVYGDDLFELFRASNIYVRSRYERSYRIDIAVWDIMSTSPRLNVTDFEKKYNVELTALLDKLVEKFEVAETQLRIINGHGI